MTKESQVTTKESDIPNTDIVKQPCLPLSQPKRLAVWHQRWSRESTKLRRVFHPRLWIAGLCACAMPEFAVESVRAALYRWSGCDFAPRVTLQGRPRLVGGGPIASRLHVGEGCIIAPRVTFGLDDTITLGRCVSIGPGATLYTATHGIGFGSQRMNLAAASSPIIVENGVWIGMQAVILPGVTLGHGCIVSAGAVVMQDVPPDAFVVGNPARVQELLAFGNR